VYLLILAANPVCSNAAASRIFLSPSSTATVLSVIASQHRNKPNLNKRRISTDHATLFLEPPNPTALTQQLFPSPTMEEESNASIHTKEVTRLWRAWRTIHEMVQDRVRIRHTASPK
jgi:hypothetical protein